MERKLRPIYDAIDARNYKQGLKLCTSYNKKSEVLPPLVLVLKALCLERLAKREEALLLCDQVVATVPTDETLLNTLVLVYKTMGKSKKKPNSADPLLCR